MRLLLCLLFCFQVSMSFAESKDSNPKKPKTWSEVKKGFAAYVAKYKNKKLSLSQKQDLIKPVNELIVECRDVKLLSAEKSDMIQLVIELVRVSQDVDVTNTHSENLYPDYKLHKKAYLSELERIQSPKERKRATEDFRDWESYDLSGT